MVGLVRNFMRMLVGFAMIILTSTLFLMDIDIKHHTNEWMKIIQSEDEEALFNVFLEGIRTGYEDETKEEIKRAFEFIDGKIVSYGNYRSGSGMRAQNPGDVYYYSCTPSYDVETDTGKKYTVMFGYHYIDDEEPYLEGLHKIIIYEGDGYDSYVEIGRYY